MFSITASARTAIAASVTSARDRLPVFASVSSTCVAQITGTWAADAALNVIGIDRRFHFPKHLVRRRQIASHVTVLMGERPPFPYWLGFVPWGQTLERWRSESGLADLDVCRYFGFEPFAQVARVEYGPLPHFERRVLSTDDQFIVAVDRRGITTRNRRDGASMPDFIAHPIATVEDWRRYKAERLQPLMEQRLKPLDDSLSASNLGDRMLQVGVFPWGVFGTARDLLGAQPLLYAFYDEPDMVADIMETLTSLWLQIFEAVADLPGVQIDHIHIWEDMSGRSGSLISPDMVERFMMPQYDRLAAFARDHGVGVLSVDSDGDLAQLVPVMAQHGVNAFMPFEVQAGCDIIEYRRRYPTLGIMGGLDKRSLAADRTAIHRELDRAERMFASGRYIAGFDHLIPPNVPWENFRYAVEHLRAMALGT